MKTPHSALRTPPSALTPLDYAYRLLARRSYGEKELAEKLSATGFTAHAVTRVVAQLKTQGYLDDTRLVADQVERLRARGIGPERIKAELIEKGLPEATVEGAVETDSQEQDLESARRLLSSRFSADALQHRQTRARAFRLLLRRGYAQEVAESLLGSEPDDPAKTEIETEKE
jgi:regulatory protein